MVLTGTYEWSQTDAEVVVVVPLKSASRASVNLDVTRLFVKINYRPYLLLLDLFAAVDVATWVSSFDEAGALRLSFRKEVAEQWPALLCPEHADKKSMQARREAQLEERTVRAAREAELAKERKMKDEKHAVKMQMRGDEMERQAVDDLRAEEKEEAERAVYDALRELQHESSAADKTEEKQEGTKAPSVKQTSKSTRKPDEKPDEKPGEKPGDLEKEEEEEEAKTLASSPLVSPALSTSIFDDDDCGEEDVQTQGRLEEVRPEDAAVVGEAEGEAEGEGDDLDSVLPAPRASARVKLGFTTRVFNTPMRESKREEEEDWLLRNRRHLQGKAKARLEGVDISERDPFWLKGKGDDFFRASNFEGAVNAYTCALEVDPGMASCQSNRAACFLKMGHLERCVKDCDAALATLAADRREEVAAAAASEAAGGGQGGAPKELRRNRAMRKKLHVRKGTALRELGRLTEALSEYQLAVEEDGGSGAGAGADPSGQAPPSVLRQDCARLEALVRCAALKSVGDEAFGAKAHADAAAKYSEALALDPDSVACLCNRSACHLKLGDADAAAADLRAGLALLDAERARGGQASVAAVAAAVKTKTKTTTTATMTMTTATTATAAAGAPLETKMRKRLAGVLGAKGQWAEAALLLERVLELNSDDFDVALRLKAVQLKAAQQLEAANAQLETEGLENENENGGELKAGADMVIAN